MNNRINIFTDDIFWASAIAGAAMSAIGPKKEVNPGFQISFQTSNPVVKRIADRFSSYVKDGLDIHLPTEEHELRGLDGLAAQKRAEESAYMHGMTVDPDFSLVQGYTHLAQTLLLFKAGVVTEPSFWYPTVPEFEYRAYSDVVAVAMEEDLVDFAEGYLEGFGASGRILVPKDLDEAVKAVNSPSVKIVVATRSHPINVVLRSYYGSYDRIATAVPMLLVLDDEDLKLMNDRKTISWPGQLALFRSEGKDEAAKRGKTWANRAESNFNIFEHIRKFAAGAKS